jgi:hypothetical protein
MLRKSSGPAIKGQVKNGHATAHDSRAASDLSTFLATLDHEPHERAVEALTEFAHSNPVAFFQATLNCGDDDIRNRALGLLKDGLPRIFADLAKRPGEWHRLRHPHYLAPLNDGSWIALNAECTPLGYQDFRPYDPLPYFANLTWTFPAGFDPRSMKGVWRPRSIGGGFTHGWDGLWLSFTRRNHGAAVGRVLAETLDPLRNMAMLLRRDVEPDPPDAVLAAWRGKTALAA